MINNHLNTIEYIFIHIYHSEFTIKKLCIILVNEWGLHLYMYRDMSNNIHFYICNYANVNTNKC